MQEMPLPALFEQAKKIHDLASESSVDQVVSFYVFLRNFAEIFDFFEC